MITATLPDSCKADAFVQAMGEAYRAQVLRQPDGDVQHQWHWERKVFIPVEKPQPQP